MASFGGRQFFLRFIFRVRTAVERKCPLQMQILLIGFCRMTTAMPLTNLFAVTNRLFEVCIEGSPMATRLWPTIWPKSPLFGPTGLWANSGASPSSEHGSTGSPTMYFSAKSGGPAPTRRPSWWRKFRRAPNLLIREKSASNKIWRRG